jgi:hypothetical protein
VGEYVRNYIYSHVLSIRDACLCIFVFLYFHSNIKYTYYSIQRSTEKPTTLHLAWTAASFPFRVLMLPSAVHFVEVPLPTSFYFFSFLQITCPICFGCFSCSLKILFLFLLSTSPLVTCGEYVRNYIYYHALSIRDACLCMFVFLSFEHQIYLLQRTTPD